jgi:hypothetical protein
LVFGFLDWIYSNLVMSVSVHMEMSRIIFNLFLDSISLYIFTECHEQMEHCKGEDANNGGCEDAGFHLLAEYSSNLPCLWICARYDSFVNVAMDRERKV